MRAAEERQRGVKAGAGSRRAMEQRLPVVAVGGVTVSARAAAAVREFERFTHPSSHNTKKGCCCNCFFVCCGGGPLVA